jgi:hypothetical protein
MVTTRRRTAGVYTVHHEDGRSVTITQLPRMGWVAAADWDRASYGDPQPTLRDAKKSAAYLLATPTDEGTSK